MKKDNKKATAYHEAGHAVAHWKQSHRIGKVSIIRDEKEGSAGHVEHYRTKRMLEDLECGTNFQAEIRARREIIALLAGHEAQRLVCRRISSYSWSADRHQIIDLMSRFVDDTYSDQKKFRLWWKLLRIQTQDLVNSNKDLISALAEQLLKCDRMTGREVRELLLKEFDRRLVRIKKK